MLEAIQAFMPIDERGVGALTYSSEDRKNIAKNTRNYQCPVCNQKLKDHEQIIIENRKFIEEKEIVEKRERLLSEDHARKLAVQEEEETKQYFIKKSIDQSNLIEYQNEDDSEPNGHFGVSPRGKFGAGPNIPCHKGPIKPVEVSYERKDSRNIDNKNNEDKLDDQISLSKPSINSPKRDVKQYKDDRPVRRYSGEPEDARLLLSPEKSDRRPTLRCIEEDDMSPEASIKELAQVRDKSRALIDGFLGKKDIASLEALLKSQLLEGKIRVDSIMDSQYRSFVEKINSVTYSHKDQVYDSLASLLREAIEMQSISRTLEFHENEAVREEKERKEREVFLKRRESMEASNENKNEDIDPAIEEEERVKQSTEYKALQKRLKLFDFMIFGLVFTAISYFSWDILKFIVFGN